MRVLVLSDIHYPYSNAKLIENIVRFAKADRIVVTGDAVVDKDRYEEFMRIFSGLIDDKDKIKIIRGDEDKIEIGEEIYRETIDGRKFVFVHGHQFQILSEGTTEKLAIAGKRFIYQFPLVFHSVYARLSLRLTDEYLIMGHSHALRYFRLLKTAYAGTLYEFGGSVYSEFGFIIIDNGEIKTFRIDRSSFNDGSLHLY